MIQSQLEQVVEKFERAQRQSQTPPLAPFVADLPATEKANVVVELVRSDIEYRWENGLSTRDIDSYRQEFSQVFSQAERLREIAFEDCRQRLRHGQPIDSNQYAKRYGIDVSDWQFEPIEPSTVTASRGLPPNNEYVRAIHDYFADFVPQLELGRGAAGRVYLASQGELAKRLVALKITNEPNFEPLQLAQLQHSNIVPIYSVHRHDDWQAVVMPFMGHFTLGDFVKLSSGSNDRSRRGRELLSTVAERTQETIRSQIPTTPNDTHPAATPVRDAFNWAELRFVPDLNYVQTCVWLVSHVAAGLAHAHRRGIVHSDMKPSNILIGHDGEPLILDFHLAHRLQGERPNFIGGTLPYMSADHLRALNCGEAPTSESDVYSLGVILYQMLTGELPYPERKGPIDEVSSQMIADRQSKVARPSSINPLISPDIDAIALKALSPEAKNGYACASELETDLRRHLDSFPPKYAKSFSPRERMHKWLTRHPGIRSGGFITLVAAALLTAILSWVAFRVNRDARKLDETRFTNAMRELNDTNAVLVSGNFGGASLADAIAKTMTVLRQNEIPDDAAPTWNSKLTPAARTQLGSQLGEVHYLIAATHLQNLRGNLVEKDRQTELDSAQKHHQIATELFGQQQLPNVVKWQAEQLRDPTLASNEQEWERFAKWVQVNKDLSSNSTHWLDQRLLAIEHYRQGDFRAATTLLESGLKDHASDYPSWLILGNAYAKAKNFAKAEMCYLVCQTLRPNAIEAYFNRGFARIEAGLFDGAIADFNRCIDLDSAVPEYFANRGFCYYNKRDFKNAESDLTKAIELGSTATRLYFFRSQVRAALGNKEGADADLATGLKLVPEDELSWTTLGYYAIAKNPEQAISYFQNAIRLNPRSADAWVNCATVYTDNLNDVPKAIECMDQLIKIEPENPTHLATRGALYARVDNRDAALADAQAALKLSSSGEALYRVGSIFARLTEKHPVDGEQAMKLIRAAASKEPIFVFKYLGKDVDLKPILERPDFKELSERLTSLLTPPKPK